MYNIYPTLLDSFIYMKRHDEDEGAFQQLIDKINGVKSTDVEQANKGIEFERLVNGLIDGISIDTNLTKESFCYVTENFKFGVDITNRIVEKLKRATKKQEYIEAIIHTNLDTIKLYGIVDYSFPEMDADLKTGKNYRFGKYDNYTQHKVYSLIRKVNGNPIKQFNYVATDFKHLFIETKDITEEVHEELLEEIQSFIRFLIHFKHLITDRKVFGEQITIKTLK